VLEKEGIKGHVNFIMDYFWRHRFGNWSLAEDAEKIIITHRSCGSGGRLIDQKVEGSDGYYAPACWALLNQPGPHTWGEKKCPIYCSQCSWFHEILPVHLFGEGAQWWVHASPFPAKSGDPCIHYIYKNPNDIPEQFYNRIGMRKSGIQMPDDIAERLFSDDDLADLSKTHMELALAALDKGDLSTARHWCEMFAKTTAYVHDMTVV